MTDPTSCTAVGSYCERCDLLVGLDGFHVTDVKEDDGGRLTVTIESAPTVMGWDARFAGSWRMGTWQNGGRASRCSVFRSAGEVAMAQTPVGLSRADVRGGLLRRTGPDGRVAGPKIDDQGDPVGDCAAT